MACLFKPYRDLMTRLRASIRSRTELPFGYSYRVDTASIAPPELADRVMLERLCCPFLNFLIEIDTGGVTLPYAGRRV